MANHKAVATTRRHLKFKKTDKPFRKHGPLYSSHVVRINSERIFFFRSVVRTVAQPFFFYTGFSQPTLDNH